MHSHKRLIQDMTCERDSRTPLLAGNRQNRCHKYTRSELLEQGISLIKKRKRYNSPAPTHTTVPSLGNLCTQALGYLNNDDGLPYFDSGVDNIQDQSLKSMQMRSELLEQGLSFVSKRQRYNSPAPTPAAVPALGNLCTKVLASVNRADGLPHVINGRDNLQVMKMH